MRDLGADFAHVRDAPAHRRLAGMIVVRKGRDALAEAADLPCGSGREAPFKEPDGAGPDESGGAGAARPAETAAASARLRPRAYALIDIEQLAAMADQPIVVKREDTRNLPLGQRPDDPGRQTGEVMDVRDVGLKTIDHVSGHSVDRPIRVRVLELSDVAKGVVDPDDAKAGLLVDPGCVLIAVRFLFAGQDEHVIARVCTQSGGVRPRIQLGAALRCRRESMDNLQNPHQTILNRLGVQPLTAAKAPKYCPSGHAKASATLRRLGKRPPAPASQPR
jgi:hypothetical protein